MANHWLKDSGTAATGTSFGLLILRVGIGVYMALFHGLAKLQAYGNLKEKFPVPDVIGFLSPQMSLNIAIATELGAATLIVLGFFTRPAAVLLGLTMAVAAFQIHGGDPWSAKGGPSKEMAMLYLIPMLALVFSGAGKYSIDHSLSSRR